MIKQRGLGLKIFFFVFMLITLVVTVLFGVLYFALPGFYYMQKKNTLRKNTDNLERGLNAASTVEECKSVIADFATMNNASVVCYDVNGFFIPELSSPFLLIKEPVNIRFIRNGQSEKELDKIGITAGIIQGEAGEKNDLYTVDVFISDETSDNPLTPKAEAGEIEVKSTGPAIMYREKNKYANMVIEKGLENGIIGQTVISSTLQPIDEAKDVLISLIPYLLVIVFIIAWIASYLFAKQLTRPILKISDAAAMMQEMRPEVLSNVRSADELGQLSQNLDSLYLSLRENINSLKIEMDKTAALEQSKTEFMRAAGHELKTPIAALNGMIEGMIDNVGVYKDHNKYLNQSKEQVDKLAALVNEILVSAGREYADETIELEDINIRELVEEAAGMHELMAEKKKIVIMKNIYDLTVKTNAHLMLNTFSNLISNAVKYTPPKGKVTISIMESDDGNILSFENECPHIDELMLPKLFEPFFTLNFSRNKSESGTGLGLYIVKRNLEKLKLPFKIENTETGIKISILYINP